MKRISILIISLLLVLTSCGVPGKAPVENDSKEENTSSESRYDMQQEYAEAFYNYMCQIDDVYYFTMQNWIHYYDKSTEASGVLCAKPECTHDNPDCNAYVSHPGKIMAYDNKIYSIDSSLQGTSIYCLDKDGTNRRKVRDIGSLAGLNGRLIIHRGYAYTYISHQEVVDGKTSTTFEMYQYSLEDQSEGKLLMTQKSEYIQGVNCRIVGDQLYLTMQCIEGDNRRLDIYVYDITKGEWEKQWTGEIHGEVYGCLVEDGKIQFLINDVYNLSGIMLAEYDIASRKMGEEKTVYDTSRMTGISKKYICAYRRIGEAPYTIVDYDGNVIDSGIFMEEIETAPENIQCQYIGADGDAMFFLWIYIQDDDKVRGEHAYVFRWTPEGVDTLAENFYAFGGAGL